jgi:hypothetical protein
VTCHCDLPLIRRPTLLYMLRIPSGGTGHNAGFACESVRVTRKAGSLIVSSEAFFNSRVNC